MSRAHQLAALRSQPVKTAIITGCRRRAQCSLPPIQGTARFLKGTYPAGLHAGVLHLQRQLALLCGRAKRGRPVLMRGRQRLLLLLRPSVSCAAAWILAVLLLVGL